MERKFSSSFSLGIGVVATLPDWILEAVADKPGSDDKISFGYMVPVGNDEYAIVDRLVAHDEPCVRFEIRSCDIDRGTVVIYETVPSHRTGEVICVKMAEEGFVLAQAAQPVASGAVVGPEGGQLEIGFE